MVGREVHNHPSDHAYVPDPAMANETSSEPHYPVNDVCLVTSERILQGMLGLTAPGKRTDRKCFNTFLLVK